MSDQFKRYIQENRDEFDDLEPSPFVLKNLKDRLQNNNAEVPVIKTVKFNYKIWMAAASITLVIGLGYVMLRQNKIQPQSDFASNKTTPTNQPKTSIAAQKTKLKANTSTVAKENADEKIVTPKIILANNKVKNITARLSDSTSASSRLAAVLAIEDKNQINNHIIGELAKTLNNDGNTNVRLAALNLLSKYAGDSYVSLVLQQSLNVQKDPIVQLGLLNILGHMKNVKIDDKLYALANDPNTFEAVKDQAYQILLDQNKL